jgi:hypothetical protein
MKKLIVAAFSALLISGFAMASGGKDDVTWFSQRSFYENFGNIPVQQWIGESQFDKAIFMKEGKLTTAYFAKDGQFIGTMQDATYADLPVQAQRFIEKKYGVASVQKILDYDDNEDSEARMSFNGFPLPDADNYFVMVRNKNQEDIVFQVSHDGEVSFFESIK